MNTENHNPILHRELLPFVHEAEVEFPINNDFLISTLNCVEKETMDSIAQPHLLVGTGGSGKTHLLRRIELGIQKNRSRRFQPIFIEGRTLFSTNDIWTHVVEQSHRTVLLIDNIRYYFERTSSTEHYELRGKLNKSGAPILIATSDKMLPAFASYDAAFFDAFRISFLRPLSAQEIKNMIGERADAERVGKLMEYLPKTPRSVFTAMDAVDKSNDPELDLMFLTDFFSDYYKSKYDELPTQIQKTLSILSQTSEGLNLRDIRDKSGLDNGKLSPYLKIMIDRKLVEKTAPTPRVSVYKISDPLFKLWLRLTRANSHGVCISSVLI